MGVVAGFLSQLEVYDEIIGLSKAITQKHRCLIFPIDNVLHS